MVEKSATIPTDVVMLDMEDAVVYTDQAKAEARATVLAAMRSVDFSGKEVIVRINPVGSPWFDEDIETIVAARPHAVVPAKVGSDKDLMAVDAALAAAGAADELRIWPGIETVGAVLRCREIAAASKRVELLRFGIGDYTVTMHGQFSDGNEHLLVPLTQVLSIARDQGLFATAATVVFSDIRRLDLVRQQAVLLRRLGYDGATVIHPSHVPEVNEVFTPTAQEIEWALHQQQVLDGSAAVVVDKRLVEMVTLKLAQRTLAMARKLGLVGA
jgi:citrate lyase subunit beta/citryl-CoA lyase